MKIKNNKTTQSAVRFLFVLLLSTIGALSYSSYKQLLDLRESNALVAQAIEVKARLQEYSSSIKDLVLKRRGYVVTRDSSFIIGVNENILLCNESLNQLVRLTSESKDYGSYWADLVDLNALIIQSVKSSIGSLPNKSELFTDFQVERKRLNEVRAIISTVNKKEDLLLVQRRAELHEDNMYTPAFLGILVFFCFGLLIISFTKINRDLNIKQKLIVELLSHETELKNALLELQLNKKELVKSNTNARFKIISDTMPQMIWTSMPDGTLDFFSQSVSTYTGLTHEDIDTQGWLEIVHPDDREENIKLWIDSIQTGKPFICEHRFKRYDGVYRWQLSRALPVRAEDSGKIEMWVGTSTDINDQRTFQRLLETQVAERTQALYEANRDLEKSNAELEQFAFIASHDLQEPLRKIQTFSQMVSEREGDMLSQKGKELFERMNFAAQRMQQLIVDVLSYSRLGGSADTYTSVDLNKILSQIENDYNALLEQKVLYLTFDKLPIIKGIEVQLRQVFANLISNAVKFQSEGIDCAVNIAYSKVKAEDINIQAAYLKAEYYHLFTVTDNGIGFDNAYKQKIFQVFQRLNAAGKYSGTGIGLALVKKIIENHNGIIDASSEEGKGASFFIYFPA